MKKIVLLFLSAFILPTSLNAESYWLIFRVGKHDYALSTEVTEMKSLSHCEEQAKIIMNDENKLLEGYEKNKSRFGYVCITGK